MNNKWFNIIYKITAAIIFTIAIISLPISGWQKWLLWIGIGMLINKHGH